MIGKSLQGLGVLFLSTMVSLSPAFAKDAYVIGCTMAVTGPGSGTYAPIKDALDIYFKDVNSRGGINAVSPHVPASLLQIGPSNLYVTESIAAGIEPHREVSWYS